MGSQDLPTMEEQQSWPSQACDHNAGAASSAIYLGIEGQPVDSDNDVQLLDQPLPPWEVTDGGENDHGQANQPSQEFLNGAQFVQERMDHLLHVYQEGQEEQRSWITQKLDQLVPQVVNALHGASNIFSTHLTNKVTQLQGKLAATTREKQSLEAYIQKLTAQNAHLQHKLNKANEKTAKALEERDEQRRLADGTPLADSAKATDSAVQTKWKELDYNIRSLANHLSQFPPNRLLEDTVKRRFRSLTRGWQKLHQDKDFTELIIQGYLWCLVDEQIFGLDNRIWGNGNAHHFKKMREDILLDIINTGSERTNPSIKQAARWCAQGSGFLQLIWGPDDKGIRTLVATETRRLRSLAMVNKTVWDRSDVRIEDEIRAIFNAALELDLMLMSSKALFFIRWNDISQRSSGHPRFNSDMMEAVARSTSLSPKSRVEFFMSPILYKCGNADGQNYDSQMVVCKASVVCD